MGGVSKGFELVKRGSVIIGTTSSILGLSSYRQFSTGTNDHTSGGHHGCLKCLLPDCHSPAHGATQIVS